MLLAALQRETTLLRPTTMRITMTDIRCLSFHNDNHPIKNTWSSWTPCTTTRDGICGNTRTTNDQRVGGNTTVTVGFQRGGRWSNGAQSGAFTLALSGTPTAADGTIGFRCAR